MYKIPERQLEHRLEAWRKLREQLENSATPFNDVIEFFNHLPKVKHYTDPYDQTTWPTAWELIEENEYCPFNIILAVCYTLKLCERFEKLDYKITITIDSVGNSVYYMLYVDNNVYGYEEDAWVTVSQLPKTLNNIKIYSMSDLH